MDVIIVCHTEYGDVRNKKVIFTKNPIGVIDGVKNLDMIAKKYGAKVTYAICPETVTDFPKKLDCEVALHIHPGWEKFSTDGYQYHVGDIYLKNNCEQSSYSTVLRDYSYGEQFLMIREGKKHIIKTLGVVPQTFLAGRWSINNDTVKAMIGNGMNRDCSAMAGQKASHFDWSKLPRICLPYYPSEYDYQIAGNQPLLIIPISQLIKGGSVNPEVARTYGVDWLKLGFLEYYLRKVPLFHICLHSPCMIDKYYVGVMDSLLRYIVKHKNINFKYVAEIDY